MQPPSKDYQRTIPLREAIQIDSEKIYYIKFLLFFGRVFLH